MNNRIKDHIRKFLSSDGVPTADISEERVKEICDKIPHEFVGTSPDSLSPVEMVKLMKQNGLPEAEGALPANIPAWFESAMRHSPLPKTASGDELSEDFLAGFDWAVQVATSLLLAVSKDK